MNFNKKTIHVMCAPLAFGLVYNPALSLDAPVPLLHPVAPQVISHFSSSRKEIALTFDACQTRKPAGYDRAIIRILRATHTPATLMLGGRWMESHPAETRDLSHDPLFELGSHSYLHPHMTRISAGRMKDELMKTQTIMYRLTGKQGTLFRPPYGEYNDALVKCAAGLGLRTLTWSLVTADPAKGKSAKAIIRTVMTQAKPGSIVIMHVNGRGWHSAEALPTIIKNLRKQGYTFVRISDVVK